MNPDAAVDKHWRWKANPIQTIVDRHSSIADGDQLVKLCRKQRKRQKPVRDRAAKWRLASRSRRIDMNPLAIAGDLGKGINQRLGHGEPIADCNLLTNHLRQGM